MATLGTPVEDSETLFDPNAVKLVRDANGLALYFSRAPIPWQRDQFARDRLGADPSAALRHIGIYAYRAGFLHDFVAWGPCWLEDTECLEQLRALYNGVRIHVADALEAPAAGVDTAEDLERDALTPADYIAAGVQAPDWANDPFPSMETWRVWRAAARV